MKGTILAARDLGELWLAVQEGPRTAELSVLPGDASFGIGAIYKGKVARLERPGGAAFVDVGPAESLFVPRPRDPRSQVPWVAGDDVLVQITREGEGRKGRRGDARLTIAGTALVLSPHRERLRVSSRIDEPEERQRLATLLEKLRPREHGLIARTAAEGADEDGLREELAGLLARWQAAVARAADAPAPTLILPADPPAVSFVRDRLCRGIDAVLVEDPRDHDQLARLVASSPGKRSIAVRRHAGPLSIVDAYRLDRAAGAALSPEVELEGGGRLVIQTTEAMTTVDVDSGAGAGATAAKRDALAIDLAAAAEIARQIRLRNLAGTIAIDFIGVDDAAQRAAIDRVLDDALEADRAKTETMPVSVSGVGLVTRQRRWPPLAGPLTQPCSTCRGGGFVPTSATRARRLLRELRRLARPDPSGRFRVRAPAAVLDDARGLLETLGAAAGLPPASRVAWESGSESVAGIGRPGDDPAGA
ncbi:MAG: ribonuclease E/G [Acidobacteriota bacterium]|nr:ribonuclease E/G [Acidobacteriota bacterium]